MTLPLDGVRILDLTRLLPGNYATLLLSGLGADVIKIEERVGGDGVRYMDIAGALVDGEAAGHLVLNRGKRSVALDLKSEAGRELMLKLVASADAVIDSFRPGVMDRLGLGVEALSAANPQIVQVSINAFGSGGPSEKVPAHDLNSLGYAGMLSLTADREGNPQMPPIQIADLASGLQAALAVVSGLRVAEKSGEAFRAEIAMTDAAASFMPIATSMMASRRRPPEVPDFLTGKLACYSIYSCRDGRSLTVAGLEPKFFQRMVELMGVPELAERQYDLAGQEFLRADLAAVFATRTRDEWMSVLTAEDTCVGPVLDIAEALQEEDFVARGVVSQATFKNGSKVDVFKSIPWLAEGDVELAAPGHGEHTAAVLIENGILQSEIERLLSDGIVGPAS